MRLKTEFIRLPLRFDVARLASEVSQFGEDAWRPHPQGYPGNSALPLVSAYGDPSNDQTKGPMRPTRYLEACPYTRQVLASFGSPIGRTRLMRIDGNGEASAHVDTNYYWLQRVRIHVPVITEPAVKFICGEKTMFMPPGEAWIFDTWRKHNVINPNPSRRIHLVADSLGSGPFWDLVERTDEEPRLVPFDPSHKAELHLESVNQPVIMSPYEQESLVALLFAELPDTKPARELRAEITRFIRDWHVVWSEHGDAPEGWPAFKTLLDQLQQILHRFDGAEHLPNGIDCAEVARQMLIRPAMNTELAAETSLRPAPGRPITRPIFIVSSPRAGSSMLFETLAQSPSLFNIGGESHGVIEGVPSLSPARRRFESNRLTAADADPSTAALIAQRFLDLLKDRDGRPASPPVRMLEKTPKNSLRIPFLNAIFPDAFFIYLYRDQRATMSSMLDAWRSNKFVTYPTLPGWEGPPWSLLLTPGWKDLSGKTLPEIVAHQWSTATKILLDDLEQLSPERWCVTGYREIVDDPQKEIRRLSDFLGIEWDRELTAPLPLSRHTLTPPDDTKVQRNAPDLDAVAPLTREQSERARDFFASPPKRRVRRPARKPEAAAPAEQKPQATPADFSSIFTRSVPDLLHQMGISVIVTTYQSGRVVLLRAENAASLNTHFRALPSPMGVALSNTSLAIGTAREVLDYRNQRELTARLEPAGRHDACFVPRNVHYTGDIRIHEIGFASGQLWAVNTRFSTLCTIDNDHSFVPRWRPSFVSHLGPEDRCHLNGMTIIDDRVQYVTALGQTNTAGGWRDNKATAGVLIHVDSNEIVAQGLSMPHSPRWYAGRFWILESGKGTVATLDLASGKVTTVAELPGFTRGLAFAGPYAFVGLSQVRESNVFGGIPLVDRVKERLCGVWVLDTRTGQVAGFLQFKGSVQEIFDIQILHGIRYPELLEPTSDLIATSYVVPDAALADVAR